MARQAERRAATTAAIMAAARTLFRDQGYEAVSIDHIAARAGCTKGAVYHHFASKQAIFDQLVDEVQGELAARLAARGGSPGGGAAALAGAFCAYLEAANAADARRIVLIDGPVVLGWARWRQIDDAHFAGMVRGGLGRLLGEGTPAAEVDAASRLMLGAIMEAALAAAVSQDPTAAIADFHAGFVRLLSGLKPLPA